MKGLTSTLNRLVVVCLILVVAVSIGFGTANASSGFPRHHHDKPLNKRYHRHHRHHRREHRPIVRPAPIPSALAIAARYWGKQPCNGQFTVKLADGPPANDGPLLPGGQAGMWTTWTSSAGENVKSGPQPFEHCTIGINRAVWVSAAMEAYTAWPEFSTEMIHEFGNLFGLPELFDENDSDNIMYIEPPEQLTITGETLWPQG